MTEGFVVGQLDAMRAARGSKDVKKYSKIAQRLRERLASLISNEDFFEGLQGLFEPTSRRACSRAARQEVSHHLTGGL